MGFYDLSKQERIQQVEKLHKNILADIKKNKLDSVFNYFSDIDTYIRKSAYLAVGKIYKEHSELQHSICSMLNKLLIEDDFKIRQTVINAAGEIGINDFKTVEDFLDKGLFDVHHSVRNAVIGSIKKMGEKNLIPVLAWAKIYLHHTNKEIRREICHGIELRGRKHPQDILDMLKELQYDTTARVRNTLIHVIGQISYKKDCLATVIAHLNNWQNKELTDKAIEEIIDMHERYKNFQYLHSYRQ